MSLEGGTSNCMIDVYGLPFSALRRRAGFQAAPVDSGSADARAGARKGVRARVLSSPILLPSPLFPFLGAAEETAELT